MSLMNPFMHVVFRYLRILHDLHDLCLDTIGKENTQEKIPVLVRTKCDCWALDELNSVHLKTAHEDILQGSGLLHLRSLSTFHVEAGYLEHLLRH